MRVLFLILLTFLCFVGSAQKSLMWRIESPQSEKPSFIYGTMHVADEAFFVFGNRLEQSLPSCNVFMPEIKTALDVEQTLSLVSQMMMNGKKGLSELLSVKDYQLIDSLVKDQTGVGLQFFEKMQPMFLSILIARNSFEQSNSKMMDDYLQQYADSLNIQIKALETVKEQMDALTSMSYKKQASILMDMVKKMGTEDDELEKLKDLYKQEDIDEMLVLTMTSEGLSKKFERNLISERNKKMTHRIHQELQQHNVFVAIGALHLPGSKGVLAKLRNLGYTVSPVYR